MPGLSADRDLQDLVARLGELPRGDVEAILGRLGEARRAVVARMLAEGGQGSVASGVGSKDPGSGLVSPWMAERIGEGGAPDGGWGMTPAALTVLRAAARDLAVEFPARRDPRSREAPVARLSGLWRAVVADRRR